MVRRAKPHAAMRATVQQHIDFAVPAPGRDDLAGAKLAPRDVADIGDFGFQAGVEPVVRGEDALIFPREDIGIRIDSVRYARRTFFRPIPHRRGLAKKIGDLCRHVIQPPWTSDRQSAADGGHRSSRNRRRFATHERHVLAQFKPQKPSEGIVTLTSVGPPEPTIGHVVSVTQHAGRRSPAAKC
jgi:hypothetical protein